MSNPERKNITVNRSDEIRTNEIANMINEGGLGAEKYYTILRHDSSDSKEHPKGNTDTN